MKDKKTGLIQTLIGAIILVIGIVLCVNTYIVKGNKAYAFSLLVTIPVSYTHLTLPTNSLV